jgi:hypothetical protein
MVLCQNSTQKRQIQTSCRYDIPFPRLPNSQPCARILILKLLNFSERDFVSWLLCALVIGDENAMRSCRLGDIQAMALIDGRLFISNLSMACTP